MILKNGNLLYTSVHLRYMNDLPSAAKGPQPDPNSHKTKSILKKMQSEYNTKQSQPKISQLLTTPTIQQQQSTTNSNLPKNGK